jgi:hypothetical protein
VATGLFLESYFNKVAKVYIYENVSFRQTSTNISIVNFSIKAVQFQIILHEFETEIEKYGLVPNFTFQKIIFIDHEGQLREYEDFDLFIEYLKVFKI